MWELQILSAFFLAIISYYDIKKRRIQIWIFQVGTAATTLLGWYFYGGTFLLYMAIFGLLFTAISYWGYRKEAWYKGEVYSMPILAAGTYSLNMLPFFISLMIVVPGTAYILEKSSLYEEEQPLIPAFLIVLIITWGADILLI